MESSRKLTDEEIDQRSRLAATVLGNAMVREALDGMRQRAIDRWIEHARPDDREDEWRFVRTIDEFERLLEQAIRLGNTRAAQKERSEERRRRFARVVGL